MASSLVLFGAGLSRRSSDLDRAWTEAARQYKNARAFLFRKWYSKRAAGAVRDGVQYTDKEGKNQRAMLCIKTASSSQVSCSSILEFRVR